MRAFRENLRRSTVIFSGYLIAGAGLLALAGSVSPAAAPGSRAYGSAAFYMVPAAGILLLILFLYQIPFMARFDNTPAESLKAAAVLAVSHPARSMAMAAAVLAAFSVYRSFLQWILPLVIMFCFTLPGYGCAKLLRPVFAELEAGGDSAADGEEDGTVY